ncbi:MAG: hypothetical protein AAFP77_20625 [Bacteroidota bacterium]
MKRTLLLVLMIVSSNLMAQINQETVAKKLEGLEAGKRMTYSEKDTVPVVVYLEETNENKNVLWYLNGDVVNHQVFSTIDPNKIEAVKVEKEVVEHNGALFEGIVYVDTKENYIPELISLNALKTKYLSIPEGISTLFLLDGVVVNMDYDEFVVAHDYILKMEVQFITNNKENLDMAIVKLTTRTKANIEEANRIRLKGVGPHNMNTSNH